jgi:hypothetical protein
VWGAPTSNGWYSPHLRGVLYSPPPTVGTHSHLPLYTYYPDIPTYGGWRNIFSPGLFKALGLSVLIKLNFIDSRNFNSQHYRYHLRSPPTVGAADYNIRGKETYWTYISCNLVVKKTDHVHLNDTSVLNYDIYHQIMLLKHRDICIYIQNNWLFINFANKSISTIEFICNERCINYFMFIDKPCLKLRNPTYGGGGE